MAVWIKLCDERRVNVDYLVHYAPCSAGTLMTFSDGATMSTSEPPASLDTKIGEAYIIEQSMIEIVQGNPYLFARSKMK